MGGAQSAWHEGPSSSSVDIMFTRVDRLVQNNFHVRSSRLANERADIALPSEDCAEDDLMCR
ncbi:MULTISPECIES: hypothetical protein [Sorangium]|uniref:hypothetical protein n=1 Tax=Sorangium TaxID=39643 RepID=UPI00031BCC19|nr:hypothetical protein [Sorangium cellulosum]